MSSNATSIPPISSPASSLSPATYSTNLAQNFEFLAPDSEIMLCTGQSEVDLGFAQNQLLKLRQAERGPFCHGRTSHPEQSEGYAFSFAASRHHRPHSGNAFASISYTSLSAFL